MQGEGRAAPCRQHARDERGQVVVLFALLLPVLMLLGSIVISLGSWYTHGRHLQTKVDAAAFAGGAVWGFPCGPDVDATIEREARTYLGEHTAADGTIVSSPYNQMLSGVGSDQIFATLNQADWWRSGFSATDFSNPAGSVCAAKVLDVKATEADTPLLWRWLPLFPDIHRKARVQIEEVDGLTGLLPIAVRLPQPLSAAAVFYDEASATKEILAVAPFRQVCTDAEPTCIWEAPAGLGQWTSEPKAGSGGSWARVAATAQTGIVIATSVRPLCGTGTPPATQPCMDMAPTPSWTGRSVDEFCQQGSNTVRCYDDLDGGGPSPIVSQGLHFLYGHSTGTTPAGPNWPELRGAWIEAGPLAPGTTCPSPYFVSEPSTCAVELNVQLDAGSCLRGPGECFDDPGISPAFETRTTTDPTTSDTNIEAKYCVVRTGQTGPDACVGQFTTGQEMSCTGSTGNVTCRSVSGKHPQIAPGSRGNAFAVQIRLRNTAVTNRPACGGDAFLDTCRFFLTGNGFAGTDVLPSAEEVLAEPLQRVFSGDLERTTPVEWLRLTVDLDCDPLTLTDRVIGHDYSPSGTDADAASQPALVDRCYVVDLGVAGGLARDQDEPPIAFNLGDNSSQRAYVDCDPNIANKKSEIVTGCQWPPYAANKFAPSPYCPGTAGFFDPANPPMAGWPPYRCVLTQTGNSSQVIQGFNERIFGVSNNPKCPGDNADQPVRGRNYWHRHNNVFDETTFAWDGTGSGALGDPDGDAKGNTLRSDDPRLVALFFTTYESFTDTGNEVYPIVGFGNFYVTGYGEVINGSWKGGGPEDPCSQGNGTAIGAGNGPPADIDMSKNTRWVWGHFVKDVTPAPFTTGGSGVLCNPEASFQPCVAVLVE
jgi:hypothetical protein